MEVVDSVIFSQLIVNFEACLDEIIKQLKLFEFPGKRAHLCRERFWQSGNFVEIVMKICRIAVVC